MMSFAYPNSVQEILRSKQNILITDAFAEAQSGAATWAYILLSGEKNYVKECFGRSENDTKDRMEILGCLEGIRAFHEVNLKSAPFILSGSKFLTEGIGVWRMSWRKNAWKKSDGSAVPYSDLWKELDVLVDLLRPKFFLVDEPKSHPSSARCDELTMASLKSDISLYEGDLMSYPNFS